MNISENQKRHITNAEAGHGLLKIGGSLIPFQNEFPKNTELYRLMTTKPSDLQGGKMRDIKTSKKTVRGLSPTGQRMKNAFAKTKKQIREQKPQQKISPTEYAQGAISNKAQAGAKKAAHLLNQREKKAVKKKTKNIHSVKQKNKSAIKTAQKSAKTTGQTVKTTAKTAQAAATTAKATAKAVAAAAIMVFVGGDGDMSDIPSDFSFTSSYFEQFNSFRLSVRE